MGTTQPAVGIAAALVALVACGGSVRTDHDALVALGLQSEVAVSLDGLPPERRKLILTIAGCRE